jgi:hypothetical protein
LFNLSFDLGFQGSRCSHRHLIKNCDPPVCECGEFYDNMHIFDWLLFENNRHALGIVLKDFAKNDVNDIKRLLKYLKMA